LSTYFRGGTTNPFAGTPLAGLASQSGSQLDIDAAIQSGGTFFLDVKGQVNCLGLTSSAEVLMARDYPVTGPAAQWLSVSYSGSLTQPSGHFLATKGPTLRTGIYLDAKVQTFGTNVELQGTVSGDGEFVLTGSASEDFGGLTGLATFTLSDTTLGGFKFAANMSASYTAKPFAVSGEVHFTFGINSGHVTYGGSASLSLQVYAPKNGYEVWDWVWNTAANTQAGISNNTIWIDGSLFGQNYSLSFGL
jgi:hypothetical protein